MLATLVFLTANGLEPTVSSLHCGHGYLTASGNVSEHSSGSAVDIAAINGTPIVGHQGDGSITDTTIRKLLALQGTMKPHQIISLMKYPNADNTLALADHYDHIHVGFAPEYDANSEERQGAQLGPQAGPVVQAHRAPRQHRQPDRLGEALQVLARRAADPMLAPWSAGRRSTATARSSTGTPGSAQSSSACWAAQRDELLSGTTRSSRTSRARGPGRATAR